MLSIAVAVTILTAQVAEPDEPPDSSWRAEVLVQSEHGMGGAAIGDLDPESPGNEVAVVNAAGEVWLARRAGERWRAERLHKSDGELIMCAIGDADPRSPGNELVAVGMISGPEANTGPGQVVLLRLDGGTWKPQSVFVDDHMIHGVAVGDVCPRHQGQEIVAGGFNHRVTLLCRDGEKWLPETIYVANDRLKIALVGDVVPQRDGLDVLVCGSDGAVVALWPGKLGWRHEVLFRGAIGQSRIAIGESCVLIGGDDGSVARASLRESKWETEFLGREAGKIRGVAVADVDDGVPGPEVYATGYARHVVQYVRSRDGFWSSRVIYRDEKPLHHLVAGDIDPTRSGDELVICGHGGKLIRLTPAR